VPEGRTGSDTPLCTPRCARSPTYDGLRTRAVLRRINQVGLVRLYSNICPQLRQMEGDGSLSRPSQARGEPLERTLYSISPKGVDELALTSYEF
jgi:hypothetical protein